MTTNPLFESNIPLESLHHVERLYAQCISTPKFTPHPTQVQRAFEIGGDVLQKTAQIYGRYWQYTGDWTQELSTDPFELSQGWEKRYKTNYCKQHPGVVLAHENQFGWELVYDPRDQSLWSVTEDETRQINESLEQLMVSYLLSQMLTQLRCMSHYKFGLWLKPLQLDDTTQWTKLWHRPDFIDGPYLLYKHTQRNVFVCLEDSRPHLYTDQDEQTDDILP